MDMKASTSATASICAAGDNDDVTRSNAACIRSLRWETMEIEGASLRMSTPLTDRPACLCRTRKAPRALLTLGRVSFRDIKSTHWQPTSPCLVYLPNRLPVQCFTLAGTHEKAGILGSGKAQTAAIPGGIARIGHTARAEKTLFYEPDRVKHCTRDDLHNSLRSVAVRPRTVCCVAFLANSPAIGLLDYWLQNDALRPIPIPPPANTRGLCRSSLEASL
jgi:hypothetical protein